MVFLIVTGGIASYSMRNITFSTAKRDTLLSFIDHLKKKEVYYVYCIDWALYWQLIFYADEAIIARDYFLPDRRHAEYSYQVERARQQGKKYAFIGFGDNVYGIKGSEDSYMILQYFVTINPPRTELEKGFMVW